MKENDKPHQQALFRAVYKKKEVLPDISLLEDESIHKFMEKVEHSHITIQDMNQLREYKDNLIEMRDSITDIEEYKKLDEEVNRVITFLENEAFKNL